jgi:hypothetical protein
VEAVRRVTRKPKARVVKCVKRSRSRCTSRKKLGAKKSRLKVYELYGATPRGPFTTYSVNYSRGTHRCIVKVRAVSIKQAYFYAGNGVQAKDSTSAGVVSGWINE